MGKSKRIKSLKQKKNDKSSSCYIHKELGKSVFETMRKSSRLKDRKLHNINEIWDSLRSSIPEFLACSRNRFSKFFVYSWLKRKVFFSLFEILIVFTLVVLVGSFGGVYIYQVTAFRRFESNCKNVRDLFTFCREMSITHQVDITMRIQEEKEKHQMKCHFFCESAWAELFLGKKERVFEPLFCTPPLLHPCTCKFYASGFVETDCENLKVSDGKREALLHFPSYFKKQEKEKPLHPFSLKEKSYL